MSRAHRGNRPLAHRRSAGICVANNAPTADASPRTARAKSSADDSPGSACATLNLYRPGIGCADAITRVLPLPDVCRHPACSARACATFSYSREMSSFPIWVTGVLGRSFERIEVQPDWDCRTLMEVVRTRLTAPATLRLYHYGLHRLVPDAEAVRVQEFGLRPGDLMYAVSEGW